MNKEIKQKWIEALRSGKYKQGRGVLNHDNKEFCCLGVLCEIVEIPKVKKDTLDNWGYGTLGNEHFCDIPPTHKINIGRASGDLVQMNDGGRSFTEIADWIEENL